MEVFNQTLRHNTKDSATTLVLPRKNILITAKNIISISEHQKTFAYYISNTEMLHEEHTTYVY